MLTVLVIVTAQCLLSSSCLFYVLTSLIPRRKADEGYSNYSLPMSVCPLQFHIRSISPESFERISLNFIQ